MTGIPVIIVGGYLGAGKTTLINSFLSDPKGLRCTVLVNDFGTINIDADLIAQHDGDTIALTNGCACCSIGDDLIGVASRIAQSSEVPDLLLVEASGVAQPGRMRVLLLGVSGLAEAQTLTVVNAATAPEKAKDKFVGRLFKSQIEQGDYVLLNRNSECEKQTERLATQIDSRQSIADIHEILHRTAYCGSSAKNSVSEWTADPDIEHKTHSFSEPIKRQELENWLTLTLLHAERIKGVLEMIEFDGSVRRILVNATRGDQRPELIDAPDKSVSGTLVSIYLRSLNDN